jgi:hypothetical protein
MGRPTTTVMLASVMESISADWRSVLASSDVVKVSSHVTDLADLDAAVP